MYKTYRGFIYKVYFNRGGRGLDIKAFIKHVISIYKILY
jgi:hypothetical protein